MRVVVTVKQLSPACVVVGRFDTKARAGLNAIAFNGRVRGRALPAGTYRISVRARSGRLLRRMIVVIVDGPNPPRDLAALRRANVCAGVAGSSAIGSGSGTLAARGTDSGTDGSAGTGVVPQAKPAAAGIGPITGTNLHSGVLGASAAKTVKALQPLLLVLLALSILLLGTASLPRQAVPAGPRVHDALARHRVQLAALGAVALVAVAVAFLLT